MKKYFKHFKILPVALLVFCLSGLSSTIAGDLPYITELHPPVVIEYEGAEIIVLFTKSSMKNEIHSLHVPYGEVFYISSRPFIPRLNYVWKIEDEEIASVFFHEWKSKLKVGKSLLLLTRSRVMNSLFNGYVYSITEFPLIKEKGRLSLEFFIGDAQDSALTNCRDGRDLLTGKVVTCPYKTAESVKSYLSSQNEID